MTKKSVISPILTNVSPFWFCFGLMVTLWTVTPFIFINVKLQFLIYTLCTLYIGSHLSLEQTIVDSKTGEKLNKAQSINRRDASLYWIIGSGVLLFLYLTIKYVSKYWVNQLFSAYLKLSGIFAIACSIQFLLQELFPKLSENKLYSFNFENIKFLNSLGVIDITQNLIFSYFGAILMGVLWYITKSYSFHNIFCIAFCLHALRYISICSVFNACILMGTLFIYDIFWVFCTDVMEFVAISFDAPAALKIPKSLLANKVTDLSLLGLGDIIIPGFFISLLLRFDYNISKVKYNEKKSIIDQDFPKFYFKWNMVAYFVGLVSTFTALHISRKTQPALLYLVPSCLLGFFVPAFYKGDLKAGLTFSEEEKS